jgi:hypothetical protein
VLDLLHDLKGAAAMTDPNDINTTEATSDDELPAEELDAVTGGNAESDALYKSAGYTPPGTFTLG